MTTILNTRIPALLLALLVAAAALPSPAGAQPARVQLDRLTPVPIPITTLAPVAAPVAGTARASGGGGGPAISELVFTTPPGPHSASLSHALLMGTTFNTGVIEILRNGRVHERITLTDVRVISVTSSSSAEDEVVLAFASMASTAGRRELRTSSP
jgi:hypothetical protein